MNSMDQNSAMVNPAATNSYLFCVMEFENDKVWVKIIQPCEYVDFEMQGIYFLSKIYNLFIKQMYSLFTFNIISN